MARRVLSFWLLRPPRTGVVITVAAPVRHCWSHSRWAGRYATRSLEYATRSRPCEAALAMREASKAVMRVWALHESDCHQSAGIQRGWCSGPEAAGMPGLLPAETLWTRPRGSRGPGPGTRTRPRRRLGVEAEGEGRLRRGLRQPVLVRQPADRGTGGEELGRVLTPDVIVHSYADPDDARGARLHGLRLHPRQREFASFVDALRELRHLLVLAG